LSAPFKRITIVGVGLIGGSLGLAIKRTFPSTVIVGVDKPAVLKSAHKKGAIDHSERNLRNSVSSTDLVVLCTPVSTILKQMSRIARYCSPGAVVTDTGSVKSAILKKAKREFAGNFIGGHPMAGKERSGIAGAEPGLFRHAAWVLSPAPDTKESQIHRLRSFLKAIGARVVVMDAGKHDVAVSILSHVPQLLSVALMNTAGIRARKSLRMSGGGFRDMTRLAASEPAMWRDILSFNKSEVRRSLRLLTAELQRYGRQLGTSKLDEAFRKSGRLKKDA
jgi:prephenate dehydrogenase